MPLIEILLTSLIISLFCCGLSIVTGEGMLLYFLRKPFENLREPVKYWFKPIILCCTCMASFWGIGIFIALHGLHVNLIPQMVICCFASCFLNAFLISKYNQ